MQGAELPVKKGRFFHCVLLEGISQGEIREVIGMKG